MNSKGKNTFIAYAFAAAMIWPIVCTAEPNDVNIPEPIKVEAVIDPRVELMSVIFYLAGNEEYNQCRSKLFSRRVDKHFKKYKDHHAVKMAKNLRETRGVSYDTVMGIAVHITDINSCSELVPFEPRPDGLDSRWQISDAREFLKTCRDFVRDTDFNEFLRQNKDMYDVAADRLQQLVDSRAKLDWFDKFFSPKDEIKFNLVISILNGPSGYGPHVKIGDKLQIYCILGAMQIDLFGWGYPSFHQGFLTGIVHEFAHSYCNPIVNKHTSELKNFGEKFYPKVEKQMKSQAYASWQTMMCESLVRACEVRYAYANNGSEQANWVAQYQVSRGFLWTPQLAELLARYEKQRDKYPDFESFMPRVVEFFAAYSSEHD